MILGRSGIDTGRAHGVFPGEWGSEAKTHTNVCCIDISRHRQKLAQCWKMLENPVSRYGFASYMQNVVRLDVAACSPCALNVGGRLTGATTSSVTSSCLAQRLGFSRPLQALHIISRDGRTRKMYFVRMATWDARFCDWHVRVA